MADNETPQGDTGASTENEAQGTSTETDWKAEARKWESRAKENLKSARANEDAAKRLADLEESQKTEAQKAQDRLEAAEKRAAELELKATRAEVAAAKGVPAELLSGSTQEELEAWADRLIKFGGAKAKGLILPNQGKTPDKTTPDPGPGVPRLAAAFDSAINNI